LVTWLIQALMPARTSSSMRAVSNSSSETSVDDEHHIPWRSKSVKEIISGLKHSRRGWLVNYRGEPSFRAWILAAIPFYIWGLKRRLTWPRWVAMTYAFLGLLAAEMHNTAIEETVRGIERVEEARAADDRMVDTHPEKKQNKNFKNAMDSAAVGVGIRAAVALGVTLLALFAPSPWEALSRKNPRRPSR
jgi:diacylglycerol kinase